MAFEAAFGKTFAALRPAPGASSPLLPPGGGGLYVVGGGDGWLRRETIRRISAHHLGPRPASWRLRRFDGKRTDAGAVRSAAETISFGGGPVLVIERGLRIAQPPLSSADRGLGGLFAGLVRRPPPKLTLVVEWERNPKRGRKDWKGGRRRKASGGGASAAAEPSSGLEALLRARVAAGTALVLDCDAPPEKAMRGWVGRMARSRGVSLPKGGAALLAERFGRDLRRQVNEIEKLRFYGVDKSGTLSFEELERVLGGGTVRNRFRFTDALRQGRTADALVALDRLLAERESPQMLLALLYQLAVQLQLVHDAGRGGANAGSVPRLPRWVLGDLSRAASRFDAADLRDLLREIARTDLRLKTARLSPRDAIGALALRFGAPRRPRPPAVG